MRKAPLGGFLKPLLKRTTFWSRVMSRSEPWPGSRENEKKRNAEKGRNKKNRRLG